MKKTRKMVSFALVLMMVMSLFVSTSALAEQAQYGFATPVDPNEEYVYCTINMSEPLLRDHDIEAWKLACKELGVKATIIGTSDFDIAGTIDQLEQAIARKPAGIGILPVDQSYEGIVKKAMAEGIPVALIGGDIPDSSRAVATGSDWTRMGQNMAKDLIEGIGGKGKVLAVTNFTNSNMMESTNAAKPLFEAVEGIEYIGEIDTQGDTANTTTLVASQLAANPDITGILAFGADFGGAAAVAVREAGLSDQVKIVCTDLTESHLDACKKGEIYKIYSWKREYQTYYGMVSLFLANHTSMTLDLVEDEAALGIMPIPDFIETGMLVIDASNVQAFIDGAA